MHALALRMRVQRPDVTERSAYWGTVKWTKIEEKKRIQVDGEMQW